MTWRLGGPRLQIDTFDLGILNQIRHLEGWISEAPHRYVLNQIRRLEAWRSKGPNRYIFLRILNQIRHLETWRAETQIDTFSSEILNQIIHLEAWRSKTQNRYIFPCVIANPLQFHHIPLCSFMFSQMSVIWTQIPCNSLAFFFL